MVEVVFTPTQSADVDELIADIRACDLEEAGAMVGRDRWERALRTGCRASLYCVTSRVDGRVANVFGVAPISMVNGQGSPWMLATTEFDKHPRAVIQLCKGYIPPMLAMFPHLVNYVDARNTRSVKWLKWLGFEVHAAEPFGPYQLPFHKFEMRA